MTDGLLSWVTIQSWPHGAAQSPALQLLLAEGGLGPGDRDQETISSHWRVRPISKAETQTQEVGLQLVVGGYPQ